MRWYPAYVGLGSNLDDPPRQISAALAALRAMPEVASLTASALYRSKPMGPVPQADFCNAAAGMLTQLPVRAWFERLRQLEQLLGRAPPRLRWGPRRIDLDLLVFAGETLNDATLELPHPGLAQRNFVLYPLAEIAPELPVPGLGRVSELLRGVSRDGLWLWQEGLVER
jgi:2-amino-4-hydroxy-6-hydroxymethyldihydropteridine diphosphokinase